MFQTAYFKYQIVLCAIIVTISACHQQKAKEVQLPYYNTPDFTPIFNTPGSITHRIADFSFTDQNAQIINQKSIEGKIHVANFFFTRCGSICPLMTNNMSLIYDSFKNDKDLVLLSYSVMPWVDSVSVLKAYTTAHHINEDNWHLLTGNKAVIYHLARTSYFAEEDIGFSKDSNDFLHTEHFVLVDRHKRIRGIYNGTLQLEAEQIIKDIRLLELED